MSAIATRRQLFAASLVVTVGVLFLFTLGGYVSPLDPIGDRPFAAVGVLTGFLLFFLFSFLRE